MTYILGSAQEKAVKNNLKDQKIHNLDSSLGKPGEVGIIFDLPKFLKRKDMPESSMTDGFVGYIGAILNGAGTIGQLPAKGVMIRNGSISACTNNHPDCQHGLLIRFTSRQIADESLGGLRNPNAATETVAPKKKPSEIVHETQQIIAENHAYRIVNADGEAGIFISPQTGHDLDALATQLPDAIRGRGEIGIEYPAHYEVRGIMLHSGGAPGILLRFANLAAANRFLDTTRETLKPTDFRAATTENRSGIAAVTANR